MHTLLHTIFTLAVSEFKYAVEPAVAGDLLPVTIYGGEFYQGVTKVCVVPDRYYCNITASEGVPFGGQVVTEYVVNDQTEWVVNVPRDVTRTWQGSERYICLMRHTADGYWDIVQGENGAASFYVYIVKPTYSIRPVMPVGADWAEPITLTIHGIGWDLKSTVTLSLTKPGCPTGLQGGNNTITDGQLTVEYPQMDPGVYYVCLSVNEETSWVVVPLDASEAGIPGVDTHGFVMYEDKFNFSGVYPKFSCSRVVAGVPTTCRLTLQNFNQNHTTELFTVTHLTDGQGATICPYPPVIPNYAQTGFELLFTFTPLSPGRLGRLRVLYDGSPIPLLRPEDDPLGDVLEDSPGNVTGIPDPSLFKFIVENPFLDSVKVGGELMINKGGEEGLSGWLNESAAGSLGSGTCCGGWVTDSRTPASGWGLKFFSPVSGDHARLYQTVTLPAAGRYRATVRFHVTIDGGDANFLGSDTDAVVTFTWKSGGGDTVASATITHTSTTDVSVGKIWGRTDNLPETTPITLPMERWSGFVDEREVVDVSELEVVVETEAGRGVVVVFDEVSLKKIDFLRTPGDEVAVLQDLYTSTSGSSWASAGNWMSGDPCYNHWQGVQCTFSRVTSISLPLNELSGPLPDLSPLTALQELNLEGNDVTGGLGNLSDTVKIVTMGGNGLTWLGGELPECIVKLDVVRNKLTELPWSVWDKVFLEYVDLSENSIIGMINETTPVAAIWRERSKSVTRPLRVLLARGNQLEGDLPNFDETAHTSLHTIDFSGNKFNGTIPDAWGSTLPALHSLYLSENHLTGTLPETFSRIPRLHLFTISVRGNDLEGVVPSWVGDAKRVDLRGNNFACPIPRTPAGVLYGQKLIPTMEACDTTQ